MNIWMKHSKVTVEGEDVEVANVSVWKAIMGLKSRQTPCPVYIWAYMSLWQSL